MDLLRLLLDLDLDMDMHMNLDMDLELLLLVDIIYALELEQKNILMLLVLDQVQGWKYQTQLLPPPSYPPAVRQVSIGKFTSFVKLGASSLFFVKLCSLSSLILLVLLIT